MTQLEVQVIGHQVLVADAAVLDFDTAQVRQIAANGGERDEQDAPRLGRHPRLAGTRRARDRFAGDEPDQRMGEIIQ